MHEREADSQLYAKRYLDQVASRLNHEGTQLHSEVLYGRVAEEITVYAEKNDIDLILIATHGRSGISRWVRGSVADKILRSVSAPVLMVRAPGTKGGI
jgi:nucleotide-binding universal stress UspA family protein